MSDYADFFAGKANFAFGGREKGVISSHADVQARMEFRAALPDENAAGLCNLTGEKLQTPVLGVTVASVL
jgi:hypothetical protein